MKWFIPGWPGLALGSWRQRSEGWGVKRKHVGSDLRENQPRPDSITSLLCDSDSSTVKWGQSCPFEEDRVRVH